MGLCGCGGGLVDCGGLWGFWNGGGGVGGWLCPEGIDGVGWFFDLLLLGARRLGAEGLGIGWAVVVGGGG